MKRSGFVLLLALSLVLAVPAWAQSMPRSLGLLSWNAGSPVGASEVVIGFAGGSTWTSSTTGICIWYLPVVGDLDVGSLFATDSFGTPVVDRAHAYLIWVSDFSAQMLPVPPTFTLPPPPGDPLYLFLAPAGAGTIYYTDRPDTRDFSDLTKRSTWGVPVATFVRKASLVRSVDNLVTDTFTFSADLVSSKSFSLNGKHVNLRDLIRHGMTCFEFGQNFSSWEAGTCVAIGGE